MKIKSATVLSAAALCASAAQAGIVYTSEAAFVGDAGSASVALPASLPGTSSFTAGPFSFQSDPGQTFVINPPQYGTPIAGDGNLLVSGYESHEITSAVALFAFGFKIFQPSNAAPANGTTGVACYFTCDQGSFTVSLFDGATLVDSFSFTPAFDTPEFHGYAGNTAFNRIRIEDNLKTIDDEYFSTYRYGTQPAGGQTVPEPGSLAMVAAALVLAASTASRGRQRVRA